MAVTEVVNERTVDRPYPVDADPVTLTTIIGEAQIGGIAVFLDNILIAQGGNIDDLPLGSGMLLRNRQLFVRTIVSDVNPQTNRTAVTNILEGGVDTFNLTQMVEADEAGGMVVYRTFINFQ